MKGLRVGGAVVSEKHANFIVADRSATATDVVALLREVRARVADATGTVLQTEIRLVGFDAVPGDPPLTDPAFTDPPEVTDATPR